MTAADRQQIADLIAAVLDEVARAQPIGDDIRQEVSRLIDGFRRAA